ncbi:DUF6165 family protein [Tenacibaculum sp. UWU-22]|uniref:DUF6165 family protein n=1 Tax=Tenacibaculum sp. UWU-22 TaxID=3234187 RepID=UPI0034DB3C4C
MKIEVSNGEIIDKYTILEIKRTEIKDATKRVNVEHEYSVLTPVVDYIYEKAKSKKELKKLHEALLQVNKKLWKIEDDIRMCERTKNFEKTFIELARAVYFTNDVRADIKKQINVFTGSDLVEEKSYEDYK